MKTKIKLLPKSWPSDSELEFDVDEAFDLYEQLKVIFGFDSLKKENKDLIERVSNIERIIKGSDGNLISQALKSLDK